VVSVVSFYLARSPVTNAEYNCFIQAGGYKTEHYWVPAGWQWRQENEESSGPVEAVLTWRQYYLHNPTEIDKRLKEGRMTPDYADAWRGFLRLSEKEARQQLLQAFPIQPHNRPYFWDDPAYNAPNQPVMGVTWYEAMAYCAWLHEQLATNSQPCTVAGVP
jgi:formylglycine-generating enzyme required for sulfatase activity